MKRYLLVLGTILCGITTMTGSALAQQKLPIDYVNTYMGNISHLLVPTYPTVHLPNSMLRVYPERADYTTDQINGLPLIVTSHRGSSAFNLSAVQESASENLHPVYSFSYDNEIIKPYYYEVMLDEQMTKVRYAPSRQSALYKIEFSKDEDAFLIFNTRSGTIRVEGNQIYATQELGNNTVVYLYAETEQIPQQSGIIQAGKLNTDLLVSTGKNVAVALQFGRQEKISVYVMEYHLLTNIRQRKTFNAK